MTLHPYRPLKRGSSVQRQVARKDVWTRHQETEIILDDFREFIISPQIDSLKLMGIFLLSM